MKRLFEKTLYILLVIAILGSAAAIVYIRITPKPDEQFTEFYILGSGRGQDDYPTEVRTGQITEVVIGIVNHEQKTVEYMLEVIADGVQQNVTQPITLANEAKWEEKVPFKFGKTGANLKVEFNLYESGNVDFRQSLYLWIRVTE